MDPGEPLEECVRREVAEEVSFCNKRSFLSKNFSGRPRGGWCVIHWFPALAFSCRQRHDRLPCTGRQSTSPSLLNQNPYWLTIEYWDQKIYKYCSRLYQARPLIRAQLNWRMPGWSACAHVHVHVHVHVQDQNQLALKQSQVVFKSWGGWGQGSDWCKSNAEAGKASILNSGNTGNTNSSGAGEVTLTQEYFWHPREPSHTGYSLTMKTV